MQAPLLSFKAGRAFRRGTTNFIDPSPTKGLIQMHMGSDELLHFHWVNRETNEVELDLIIFPTDATVERTPQIAGGRIIVLRFSSSGERHFFWLQDNDTSRDIANVTNLNGLCEDPSYEVITPVPITNTASSSAAPQPSAGQALGGQPSAEQLARLRHLIQNMDPSAAAAVALPTVSLVDILTPTQLAPVFSASPEILNTIFPNLPSDLPVPPSPEVLRRVVESPQFQANVRTLDRALRTGLLENLVVGLGLPAEAGTSVEAFLRAIGEQAAKGSGQSNDSMQTD